MKCMTTVVLTLVFAGLVIGQPPTPEQALPLEPTVNGSFYSITVTAGGMYMRSMADTIQSYPEMRKAGFDGVFISYLVKDSWLGDRMDRACKRFNVTQDEYIAKTIKSCEDCGLDFWPGFWNASKTGAADRPEKLADIRTYAKLFSKSPRFKGYHYDEPGAPNSGNSESFLAAFKEWLLKKHPTAELRNMGLAMVADPAVKILPPLGKGEKRTPDSKALVLGENPVLSSEYSVFCHEQWYSLLTDTETVLRELKPDAFTFPVLSFGGPLPIADIGQVCGGVSCDTYWDGAQEQGFWAKIMRNQALGVSGLTISAGNYCGGNNRFSRDMAIGMVHSPCLIVWDWVYVWKVPPDDPGTAAVYVKGNYDIVVKMLGRSKKIQSYLAPSATSAKVAMIYSEYGDSIRPSAYSMHCALAQLGIQYEPFFLELVTAKGIAPYDVAIMLSTAYLRPESLAVLDGWVKNGGSLIVLGKQGYKDQWDRPAPPPETLKALTGVTSVPISNMAGFTLNPAGGVARPVRYDATLSAAAYELAGARSIGQWTNNAIAAAVNTVGKGQVISLGAERISQCYIGSGGGWRYPNHKAFFPGTLECLRDTIRMAAGNRADDWTLQAVTNCPRETEVTVRRQPGRYVAHLINFRRDMDTIQGAQVTLCLPPDASAAVVAFYPEDMSRAEMTVKGRDARITVRKFDVLETVVVQYDGKAPALKDPCQGNFILPVSTEMPNKL